MKDQVKKALHFDHVMDFMVIPLDPTQNLGVSLLTCHSLHDRKYVEALQIQACKRSAAVKCNGCARADCKV